MTSSEYQFNSNSLRCIFSLDLQVILALYHLFLPVGTLNLHTKGNRKCKITLTPPTKVLTIPNTIKPKVFGFIDRNYFSMSRCYCLHKSTVEYLIMIHNLICIGNSSNQITKKEPISDDCLSKFDWHDLFPILGGYNASS